MTVSGTARSGVSAPAALDDPRVSAVLAVLRGAAIDTTADRCEVDPALLTRWVGTFVTAGVSAVVDRPDPLVAMRRRQVLAALTDDVREPLDRAHASARRIALRHAEPAGVAAQAALLEQALDELDHQVTDAGLLAAVTLGGLTVHRIPVTVAETCAGLPHLGEIHGKDPATLVEVDPHLFARVLRDVWAAAGQDTEPDQRRMWVRFVGPWVEWRVLRTGDPLDPAALHALMEPFEHDRPTPAPGLGLDPDGLGRLGLYLARALVVAHGGTIGIDQDDNGAAFWVRVPVAGPRPGPALFGPDQPPEQLDDPDDPDGPTRPAIPTHPAVPASPPSPPSRRTTP